jgi:hypothetical protein
VFRRALAAGLVCLTATALASESLLIVPLDRDRTGFLIGANSAFLGEDMELIGQELAAFLSGQSSDPWTSSLGRNAGLAAGVFHVFQQGPTLGIQLEGQYVRRGGAIELSPGSSTLDTAFRLDYVEVPLLLRFSPAPLDPVRAVLLGGASVGLRLGSSLEVSDGDQSETTDFSSGFNDLSFGLIAGFGLSFRTDPRRHITIQLRYYHGLTNVLDDPVLRSYPRDVTVLAGMAFEVGS